MILHIEHIFSKSETILRSNCSGNIDVIERTSSEVIDIFPTEIRRRIIFGNKCKAFENSKDSNHISAAIPSANLASSATRD